MHDQTSTRAVARLITRLSATWKHFAGLLLVVPDVYLPVHNAVLLWLSPVLTQHSSTCSTLFDCRGTDTFLSMA